ncbi:hypothetical protein [Leyella stercorea]|jgi:hypothetical protein|uniref:hypothetical protein n=1 Tax=Leyella stercorea TaxID=363265 RepID=UPI0026DAC945|nr:hypothetical protein [Leyella stercorea]
MKSISVLLRPMLKGGMGLLFLVLMLAACDAKKKQQIEDTDEVVEVNDTTVYGVCGEGTSMHSLEIITDAGDTLVYTLLSQDAETEVETPSDVQGGLMAGDKMAVTGHKTADELVADRVINVTSLLGHWTSIDKNFTIEEGGTVHSAVKAETNPWTSWKILNGSLLLNRDTFAIDGLSADSLYLENANGIFTFKRQK